MFLQKWQLPVLRYYARSANLPNHVDNAKHRQTFENNFHA